MCNRVVEVGLGVLVEECEVLRVGFYVQSEPVRFCYIFVCVYVYYVSFDLCMRVSASLSCLKLKRITK